MRFSTRLLWYSVVPAVVLACAAFIGVAGTHRAEQRFEHFVTNEQALMESLNQMKVQGLQMGQALRNIVLDPGNRRAHDALQTAADAYDSAAAAAADLVEGDAAVLLKNIGGFRARQRQVQEMVLDAVKVDQKLAISTLNAEETPTWREMQSRLIDLADQTHAQMTARRAAARAASARTAAWVLGVALVGAALAIVFPLLSRRRMAAELGCEPEEARRLVQAVAEGDLTWHAPVRAGDEHSLLANLGRMTTSLSRAVGELRAAVTQVSTASREIAQGNADLSSRTEQQASNLQQTAASMEQMTSSVKQNADAARQANQLAASASQVAAKGGAVVGEVVSTMDQISASSRKIADIIGVIDGIAFQTNILALNAAVEAARAGEQGRGFAVVAGEVRNLAQRSAQAAREIKSLIGESVEKVETGSKLVNDAGQTMSDIVAQVKRVTDLIGEITSSTLEQSNGIGQVNQAVAQLDQMTQQNAALVEQSAAAAESLKEQADRLAQAVAIFKLSRSQTRQLIAEAQAASRGATVARAAPAPQAASRTPPAAPPSAARKPQDDASDDWQEF
jgi:methyl-accepting chemotaxis protein